MKKSSMIFRIVCVAVCFALCLSVINVVAEEAAVEDTVVDVVETEDVVTDVTDEEVPTDVVDETENEVSTDVTEDEVEEEISTDVTDEEIEEEEVVDLLTATLRDGGVYVTPGEDNAAVFNYDGVRYRVLKGAANGVRLDGFESEVIIESEISATAKNVLQANGEIATKAAHSGYFGLSISAGDVIYRTAVSGGQIYVFSAWVKMPTGGSISDDDRAFKVVGESGASYIVGFNEIGRETEETGSWQQILFTFKAPETGLFAIDFNYKGSEEMALDDIELYEAEVFENPLSIKEIVCTDANGNEYNYSTGFTTSGTLTHKTVLYNEDEDDVFFYAVCALYKNDILVDFMYSEECALVLDEAEVTFEIEIPEDEDLSQYKYMVYFISDTAPTHFYGPVPSRTNPYVVKGN